MEQILLSKKHRQLLHNVYCPFVEQTIAICEVELEQLEEGQINYLEVPFDQYEQVIAHFNNTDRKSVVRERVFLPV